MSGSGFCRGKRTPTDINKDHSKIKTGARAGLIIASPRIVLVERVLWFYYLSTHVRSKVAYFRD